MTAIVRDITARKEADKAKTLLAAIVRSSHDAIIGKTLEGTITSWNQGAERLYGYTAEEMVGQSISRLVPPGCEDEAPTLLARLRRGERVEHYETIRRRKDSRLVHVSVTISPIRDARGKLIAHLLSVINDILALSKIEAGKMTMECITCSPARLVGEVLALMHDRARDKGLAFEVVYEGLIPERIETDPTRVRQILLNLLGNAVKFTESGGVRLTMRMAGERLAFAVADTGIGMTAEEQVCLFHPFAQTDASTTRRFGGTGLGLTITKRLVEMLGGTIHVESAPRRGSTFTVTIDPGPLNGVPMLVAPTDMQPIPAAAAAAPVGLDCRVLLAEDLQDNQRLLAFHLRKAGAEVVTAENGEVAARECARRRRRAARSRLCSWTCRCRCSTATRRRRRCGVGVIGGRSLPSRRTPWRATASDAFGRGATTISRSR